MAAAILKSKNLPNISVKSSGIYAYEGEPMSNYAQMTLAQKEIPAVHHSSKVNAQNIDWADLILTMTTAHKALLVQLFPDATNKIYSLNEYVSPHDAKDVIDPFGGDLITYEQTYLDLEHSIEILLSKLNEEA